MCASNTSNVDVSDTQDINIFFNDENTIYNLSNFLKTLKTKNSEKLVSGNLNINTINNKFEQLKCIIKNNIDVLIVTEPNLDSFFPSNQFSMNGFAELFCRDRNKNGGDVTIFVRDDISSKEVKVNFLRVPVYRIEYKENEMVDCWLSSLIFTK